MPEYDLYRCDVSFGSYRVDVAADDRTEAREVVRKDDKKKLDRAMGNSRRDNSMERKDYLMDIRPGVQCERIESDNIDRAANVEGGFVFKEVKY